MRSPVATAVVSAISININIISEITAVVFLFQQEKISFELNTAHDLCRNQTETQGLLLLYRKRGNFAI